MEFGNETGVELNSTDDWKNYLVAGTFFCFGLVSLLCYICFFVIVFVYWKQLNNVYYMFLASKSAASLVTLMHLSFYAPLCIYFQQILGGELLNAVFEAIINTAYFASAPTMQMISINRFLIISKPGKISQLYNKRNTHIILACCWTYGALYGIVLLNDCCYILYSYKDYSSFWDIERYGSYILSYIDLTNSIITCTVCIAFDAATFIALRKSRKSIQQAINDQANMEKMKSERRLFMLFFPVTCWYFVQSTIFVIIPFVTTSKWGGFVVTMAYAIHALLEGFINLFCNRIIFQYLSKCLCRKNIIQDQKSSFKKSYQSAVANDTMS